MEFLNKDDYSLKAQAGYLFSGRAIALILQFAVPIILVRIFTKNDYGVYRQILLLSEFFVPLLQLGMANSLFYFYPNAKEKVNQLLSQTFYFSLFIGMFFLPIFYFFRKQIAHLFKNDSFIELILPCSFYIFFFFISFILEYIFILEKKSRLVFFFIILNQVIRIALLLSFFIIFRTVEAVVWALVVFAVIRTFILFIYLKKNYKITIREWDIPYFFSQIKYAFPLGVGRIIGDIGRLFDKFMLSAFLPSADFAVYSIANFKIPGLNILYTSIGNVAIPQISKYSNSGNFSEAKSLWHKIIINYSLITIPLVTFFFIMAYPIITFLYTEKYSASVGVFRIFLLILLVRMLSRGTILRAFNKTKSVFKANLISMVVGIVLGYFLIKDFGLKGGAISAVITFYTNAIIQIYKSKLVLNLKFSEWLPWKKIGNILLYSIVSTPSIFLIKYLELSKPILIIAAGFLYFSILLFIYIKMHLISFGFLKEKILFMRNNA